MLFQEDCLPAEMPLLHSETSSSASSEVANDVQAPSRKRRKTRLTKKKKRHQQRESSKERTVPSASIAECNVNPACPESSATASEVSLFYFFKFRLLYRCSYKLAHGGRRYKVDMAEFRWLAVGRTSVQCWGFSQNMPHHYITLRHI